MTKRAAAAAVLAALVASMAAPAVGAYQPLRIVDFPTAGLYARGEYGVDIDLYADGGLLIGAGVGFTDFLTFGITYGGVGIIGTGDPHMNPRPEVNIRARVYNEDVVMPAIALGFDSQGYGRYFDREERYLVKSRGFYAVASKNWELFGPLSAHGGISYSLENDTDHDPTVFLGLVKNFAGAVEFALEFDLATNDNQGPSNIVEKRGYLNTSVAWYVNDNLFLAFKIRDMLSGDDRPGGDSRRWNRGVGITYRSRL